MRSSHGVIGAFEDIAEVKDPKFRFPGLVLRSSPDSINTYYYVGTGIFQLY